MHAARDETGDVRHVENVDRANFVGDLAHAGKVPQARISAGSAHDDLWLFLEGNRFHLVVVDGLSVATDVVERGAIQLTTEAEAMAMGQVATVRKVKAE